MSAVCSGMAPKRPFGPLSSYCNNCGHHKDNHDIVNRSLSPEFVKLTHPSKLSHISSFRSVVQLSGGPFSSTTCSGFVPKRYNGPLASYCKNCSQHKEHHQNANELNETTQSRVISPRISPRIDINVLDNDQTFVPKRGRGPLASRCSKCGFHRDVHHQGRCSPSPSVRPNNYTQQETSPTVKTTSPSVPQILVIGPPGSGQGTQGQNLAQRFGLIFISTGGLLRSAVEKNTAEGRQAQKYISKGHMVPDDIVTGIVLERILRPDCRSDGFVLSGYPRTLRQAKALSAAGVTPSRVIMLDVPDSILLDRIVGRRVDPSTGNVYHIKFSPPPEYLASRLIHRQDDTATAAKSRLVSYTEGCKGLREYYSKLAFSTNGNHSVNRVTENIVTELQKLPQFSPPLKLVIFGAPASGKGTQCERIVEKYGLVHVSTGDLLRAAVKADSDLGRKAKHYMTSGQLVPDEVIVGMVMERVSLPDCRRRGFLLDGFPRNVLQARALEDAGLKPDCFVCLDVDTKLLVERACGRRLDPETGAIYHIKYNPPPPEVANRVIQRADDTEETVVQRLKVFSEVLESMMSFYYDRLLRVNGNQKPDEVSSELLTALSTVRAPPLPKAKETVAINKDRAQLLLFGPPGSGRGTQGELIAQRYGLVFVNAGSLIRSAIDRNTQEGKLAQRYIANGDPVADEIITGLVLDRLFCQDCQTSGFVLSGFPRTVPQARALAAAGFNPQRLILLDVPSDVTIERVSGRRMDPETGTVYHTTFQPPPPGTSSRLIQRTDDLPAAIIKRLSSFNLSLSCILQVYNSILVRVNGAQSVQKVHNQIVESLQKLPQFSPPLKLVVFGAPASGKGTQCEKIVEKFGLVHVSTGDLLRAAVKADTDLGRKAKQYMTSGQLVPDDIIVGMVMERIALPDCRRRGFLLDGFPRNVSQARSLEEAGLKPDCFICLDVDTKVLVERACGRRLDPETGAIYHLKFNPPPREVESRLVQRADDTEETVRQRLKVFGEVLQGLVGFYKDRILRIDGNRKPSDVTTDLLSSLETRLQIGSKTV